MAFVVRKLKSSPEKKTSHDGEPVEWVSSLWKSLTGNPGDWTPEDLHELESALQEKSDFGHREIEQMVRKSVFLPPEFNDRKDLKRLTRCISDSRTYSAAKTASIRIPATRFLYTDLEAAYKRMTVLTEYIDATDDLTDSEQKLLFLVSLYPLDDSRIALGSHTDDITFRLQAALHSLSSKKPLFPSVSKTNQLTKEKMDIRRNRNAVREAEKIPEIHVGEESSSESLEADLLAQELLLSGEPHDVVLRYHHDVPPGYWSRVLELLEDPLYAGDPDSVYAALESDMNFHPDNRTIPGDYQ